MKNTANWLRFTLFIALLAISTRQSHTSNTPFNPMVQGDAEKCNKLQKCINCNSEQNECFECLIGYYVTTVGKCQSCSKGCFNCVDGDSCDKCK